MRSTLAVAALAVSAVLACGAASAATSPAPVPGQDTSTTVADDGSDVGNGRPVVTHDGLMVRRLAVVALRVDPRSDTATAGSVLRSAAERLGTAVTSVSTSVLDAAVLERLRPDLVEALPLGATTAQAHRLADVAFGAHDAGAVEDVAVELVLVHDLRFTLRTSDPVGVARAVAREGILSDALGSYTTRVVPGQLDVLYTGPLLSDRLVDLVRAGIARPARESADAVTLGPRSTRGGGVDLTTEPLPPPEPAPRARTAGHEHLAFEAAAAQDDPTGIRGAESRSILLIGALALILLLRWRRDRPLPDGGR